MHNIMSVSSASLPTTTAIPFYAPSDTLATGTSIQPQATTEDSIQQETPAETTTDTPVVTEENTQAEQPATVQETPQEKTTQQQEATETEQQTIAE